MKKGILVLAICIVGCIATLYGKRLGKKIMNGTPVSKTVCFSINAGTDYTGRIYRKSTVKVVLSIYKYKNNQRELVWKELVDEGNVKNYNSNKQSLYREVTVYNVLDRHETLAAFYETIYNSKGSKFSYVDGLTLSQGSRVDSLNIVI